MFAALSDGYGNLDQKINTFIALAPVVNLKMTTSTMISGVSYIWNTIYQSAKVLNLYDIGDPKPTDSMREFCYLFESICDDITSYLNITSPYEDPDRQAISDARPGSHASTKELIHYA